MFEQNVNIFVQFRGHQVRQDMKDKPAEEAETATAEQPAAEEIDIDLDDPASLDAAVKIQVHFQPGAVFCNKHLQ